MLQIRSSLFILICLFPTSSWSSDNMASERFIRLNTDGKPFANPNTSASSKWPCVLDRKTGLTWEVKTLEPGLHNRDNTYSWFNPDSRINGGLAGHPGGTNCHNQACDTERFIEIVNKIGWCNAHDWRLPNREELRSLVDYRKGETKPTLDSRAFPNSATQFYWSANPSATNPDEAWGIGFAFGYDYTYYKKNRVHVRLVRNTKHLASRGITE